jgi:hypothetical protein
VWVFLKGFCDWLHYALVVDFTYFLVIFWLYFDSGHFQNVQFEILRGSYNSFFQEEILRS